VTSLGPTTVSDLAITCGSTASNGVKARQTTPFKYIGAHREHKRTARGILSLMSDGSTVEIPNTELPKPAHHS